MTTSSIGTSARDYSTVQAWENACPADITAAGTNETWKGECYNDSEFLVTSGDFLTVSGTTTDSTHYLWLTCAAGQSYKDAGGATSAPLRYNQTNGVGFRATDGYGWLFKIQNSTDILIEGIQAYHDTTGVFAAFALSGQNATFKDVVVETRKESQFAESNYLGKCINSVFVARGSTWSGTMFPGGWELHNCTIVRPSDLSTGGTAMTHTIYSSPPGPLAKNCAVFGAFTTMFGGTLGSYQAGTGYNASSVASGSMPGTNNQASLTFGDQFENTADSTRDWRPKSGNSLGNGARDQTNTNDLDIIGFARSTSTPTIGAREVGVVGAVLVGAGSARALGDGALTARVALAGSGASRADSLGALFVGAALAGGGSARSEGLASLTVRAELAGSGHAVTAGLGQLASGAVFAGSGAALSHGGGALTVRAVLAGDGRARADGFATLVVRVALAGAGRVAAAGAAVLAVPYRSPDLLGNIPLWRLKARFAAQEPAGATFSGTGAARSLGAGTLTVRAAPAGSGQANAAGLGVLAVRAVLAGVGVARSSGEGALNSGAVLSGSGAAAASGQAQLTVRVALVGSGLAAAEGLGNLAGPGAVLVGSGVARAASQADLQPQYAALQAIASAQASSIAALRVYAALVGTGSVITSGRGVLPSAGGETPVPEQVFKLTTASRIFRLATVTRINEKAGA